MHPTALAYEIILKETLRANLADWFEGSHLESIAPEHIRLCGELPDQAALHGILERIRDLNLRLVSVQVREIYREGEN